MAKREERDEWSTPDSLYVPLNLTFQFQCDLAARPENKKCEAYLTNSLHTDWHRLDGWLWLNPPFSLLAEFTDKCRLENQAGARIVCLLPANRTGRRWFQQNVLGRASQIWFLNGRIQYETHSYKESSCSFDSCLAIYDHDHNGGLTYAKPCSL